MKESQGHEESLVLLTEQVTWAGWSNGPMSSCEKRWQQASRPLSSHNKLWALVKMGILGFDQDHLKNENVGFWGMVAPVLGASFPASLGTLWCFRRVLT